MSASNNNTGFTVPRGPREKLTVDEAKARHEMDKGLKELRALIDDLEKAVA